MLTLQRGLKIVMWGTETQALDCMGILLTSSSFVGVYCVILEATPRQSVNHLLPPLL